jgi:hypothetical protein
MTFLHDGRIFIGSHDDYEAFPLKNDKEYAYVLAAKFPWHRNALGYTGVAAPKDHDEYLIARRNNKLILNLIDPRDPVYISKDCMQAAVKFIDESLNNGKKVGVFCNKGRSRAPAIVLSYLRAKGLLKSEKPEDGFEEFKALYPFFEPGEGMTEYLKQNWSA